jgi:hypothetical protein
MNSVIFRVAVLLLAAALPAADGRVHGGVLVDKEESTPQITRSLEIAWDEDENGLEDVRFLDEIQWEDLRMLEEGTNETGLNVTTGLNNITDRSGGGIGNGNGKTTAPAPATSTVPASAPTTAWMGLNLYEVASQNIPFPNCGDVGQNDAFQGAALKNAKGECVRINICHGNAGFGWNRITVDRSALGVDNMGNNGHANQEHNDRNQKRPDYFPGGISVPNPRGAGVNGALDGRCDWKGTDGSLELGSDETTAPTSPPTNSPTTAPTKKPTAALTNPPTVPPTSPSSNAPTKKPIAPPTSPLTLASASPPVSSVNGDPHFKVRNICWC